MKRIPPVVKNQELEAEIVDLTYQGMGVAKVEDYSLFVAGALPGEKVKLHVLKVGKNFGFAKVVEWLTTSPDRVEIKGKAYTQTGIAPLQHLKYPAQLKFKRQQIVNLLEKAHLDKAIPVEATIGMDNPYNYRNKAQVPVRKIKGHLETGFFRQGSHKFLPLADSLIEDKRINEVIQTVQKILDKHHLSGYNEREHRGLIRNIMVRRGYYSHDVMLVLVTLHDKIPDVEAIVKEITAACPDIKSIIQNVNPKKTNVIMGKEDILLYGQEKIMDELNGLKFEISAQSFYQVNPQQTEVLYQQAIDAADLTPDDTVIDAYCGIGTISLSVAQKVKKVLGVEIVPEAIADAKNNATLNGLTNLDFEVGRAEDQMAQWQEAGVKPDVIFVDPPRKGLDASLIESAAKMNPKKIVYVSCNPATLVRDIQLFMDQGYQVRKPIQPVDMFPQTPHVESVTVLERTEK